MLSCDVLPFSLLLSKYMIQPAKVESIVKEADHRSAFY